MSIDIPSLLMVFFLVFLTIGCAPQPTVAVVQEISEFKGAWKPILFFQLLLKRDEKDLVVSETENTADYYREDVHLAKVDKKNNTVAVASNISYWFHWYYLNLVENGLSLYYYRIRDNWHYATFYPEMSAEEYRTLEWYQRGIILPIGQPWGKVYSPSPNSFVELRDVYYPQTKCTPMDTKEKDQRAFLVLNRWNGNKNFACGCVKSEFLVDAILQATRDADKSYYSLIAEIDQDQEAEIKKMRNMNIIATQSISSFRVTGTTGASASISVTIGEKQDETLSGALSEKERVRAKYGMPYVAIHSLD